MDMDLIDAALAGLAQSSKRKYRPIFASFLEMVPLQEAKPIHVRAWASKREGRVSRRTLKQQLYMLSRLFKVAGRDDLSEEARKLAKEMRAPPPLPKVDSSLVEKVERIDELLGGERPLVKAAITMLADTGMRVGELVSLRWDDVDLAGKRAKVRGKGGKERYVYFTELTASLLRGLPREGRVFPVSARTVERWVSKLLNTHPHALRHAFAVWFLSRGGNPRVLQRILGHGSLRTTEIYLDLAQSLVERGYREVVRRRASPPPGGVEEHGGER